MPLPCLTYFFADDSMVFCRANKIEAGHIMDILEEYQSLSGQKINLQKSEMVFSPNLLQSIKTEFQTYMPIQISENISKYLGLPTQVGRSKNQIFDFIMERVRKKLKVFVIQAIPTYVMSTFLICNALISIPLFLVAFNILFEF